MVQPPHGTVTLLFTDIEGSTQLLRRLGNAYAVALADHQRLLRAGFAAHDGYEVDTQGDAFFVAFASALDAVHAAVAAQHALASHPWPAGTSLRVRMGVHTGEPLEADGRYIGLDVHRAARIGAAAHGGQVLVSQATAALLQEGAGSEFGLRELGSYTLKDFDEAEPLFQLVADGLPAQHPPLRLARADGDEADIAATGETRFVGRVREFQELKARLGATGSGRGGLALLAGEPGIGKSRLARELAAEAARRGYEVFWGRCWEGGGAPPFWPWTQILRGLIEQRPPLVLRSELGSGSGLIAELLPELRDHLPDLAPVPLMASEEGRFQLFAAIAAFLGNVAHARPHLLVLDDLHWADKPSLLLLQFLQQEQGRARLLTLGTDRDVEVHRGHPLAEVLPSLRRAPGFQHVSLAGLQADAAEDLMGAFLHQPIEGRERLLARALQQQTDGNPFFLQEELRYCIDQHVLVQEEGRWTSTSASPAELDLPQGVREVIERRLAGLSEQTNTLLTLAAVVGREFDAEAIEHLSGADEDAVDMALAEAAAAHVVAELPRSAGRYRFDHALTQETLYAALPTRRRLRLHRQVAELLEQRYAPFLDAHTSELAYHFVAAAAGSGGDPDKAIAYARRAGGQAMAGYAYEEAVRHFEAALRVQDAAGERDELLRCDLLLALADALMPSGEPKRVADEVAPAALALAAAAGDDARAFHACRVAVEAFRRFGMSAVVLKPEVRNWIDRGRAHAASGSAGGVWVEIMTNFVRDFQGQAGQTWEARLQALTDAQALGEDELIHLALSSILANATASQWPKQVQIAQEFAGYWPAGVPLIERGIVTYLRAERLLDGGDVAGRRALYERLRPLAEQTRDPSFRLWLGMGEQAEIFYEGRLEDNLAFLNRLLDEARQHGAEALGLQIVTAPGARTRLYLGRATELLGLLEALGRATDLPPNPHAPHVVLYQAHLGRQDEVRAALDWLLTPAAAAGERETRALVQYLEAAILSGHREATALLSELLAPAAEAATLWPVMTCAARHLGSAAALLGRPEQALAFYQQALDVSGRINNRPELALTHLALAELLLDAGNGSRVSGFGDGGDAGAGNGSRVSGFGDEGDAGAGAGNGYRVTGYGDEAAGAGNGSRVSGFGDEAAGAMNRAPTETRGDEAVGAGESPALRGTDAPSPSDTRNPLPDTRPAPFPTASVRTEAVRHLDIALAELRAMGMRPALARAEALLPEEGPLAAES